MLILIISVELLGLDICGIICAYPSLQPLSIQPPKCPKLRIIKKAFPQQLKFGLTISFQLGCTLLFQK